MKLQIKCKLNPTQQELLDDMVSKYIHMSGGYGCFDADTRLLTIEGYKRPEEINCPTFYLSFDGEKPVWIPGTSPFLKGKDDLYRVIHEHGEFLVTAEHRVFCSDYAYRHVRDLSVGDSIHHESSSFLSRSNLESFQLKSGEDVRHLKRIASNYLDDYSTYYHQYDQRLLSALNSGPISFPLSDDVQESTLPACSFGLSHMDDQVLKLGHIHRDQSFSLLEKIHSKIQLRCHGISVEHYAFAKHSEHIYRCIQQSQQSDEMSSRHHSHQESSLPNHLTLTTSKASSKILSIEKVKNDWFWDVHIPFTNNYYAEGAFHHNSGKTTGLAHKMFKLSWKNRDINGGLVCPSYTDFKRDVKLTIEQECDLNKIKFFYHNSEHWYQFPWSQGKIYVTTAEKPLKGPNWGFALINELTLIPFERYRETIARVRVKRARYPQIASCGTPEGLLTGYYKFFIEEPDPNAKVLYASTDENMHNLSGDYLKSLQSAYDQRQLEAYRHGKFINSLGNRFYYSYDPDKNCTDAVEDKNYPVLISMDFNVDPMVATIWQWQNKGSLAAVNEIVLRENADTNKMAEALKARGYGPDRTEIYPDPAGSARSTKGQPDVVILRNHGFYNIKVRPAAPPFRKRQLNVCNLFEKRKLEVNKKMCPWMHRDLLLCTQDQVNLIKEKSSPELTHSSDGLDYLCDIVFEFSGRKPQSGQITIR